MKTPLIRTIPSVPLLECFHLFPCRKIPVEGSKITAALWGPFDEFLVTGHENGAICRYDITRVHLSMRSAFLTLT